MIQKEELRSNFELCLKTLDSKLAKDPDNKAMKTLPSNFWMNSIGGKAAKRKDFG